MRKVRRVLYRETVSVLDYGAKGTWFVDDTEAIQAAIDSVGRCGGGVVYFPPGCYRVSPSGAGWARGALFMRDGVTLRGESDAVSTIKLTDDAGPFRSLVIGEPEALGSVGFQDLGFDLSGSSQSSDASPGADARLGLLVQLTQQGNMRVEGCRFKDADGTNVVVPSAGFAWVTDCLFEGMGDATTYLDHSTVYTSTTTAVIRGNRFVGGFSGSRNAIELHGQAVVDGNIIDGYQNGVTLTGTVADMAGSRCVDNVVNGCVIGVIAQVDASGGCGGLLIGGNHLSIDRDRWEGILGFVSFAGGGIVFNPLDETVSEDVQIVNNTVRVAESVSAGGESDYVQAGVAIWGAGSFRRLRIEGNDLSGCLANGIYVACPVEDGQVVGNTVVDAGSSRFGMSGSFRAGFLFTKVPVGVRVAGNVFHDSRDLAGMTAAVNYSAGGPAVDCVLSDSLVRGMPLLWGDFSGWSLFDNVG